jgi:hypothetical protein
MLNKIVAAIIALIVTGLFAYAVTASLTLPIDTLDRIALYAATAFTFCKIVPLAVKVTLGKA